METRPITDLFTDSDEEVAVGLKLLEAYRFWNKKRLPFNIIVGTAGLLSVLFFFGLRFNVFDILGIIVWGLLANALYSVGYVLDSYLISISQGSRSLADSRVMWFWLGTIAYVIATFVCCVMYALPHPN